MLFLIFDYMTSNYLFRLSIEHETIVRKYHATPLLDKLALVISELGDKYIVGILLYISFHLLESSKAFILLMAVFVC